MVPTSNLALLRVCSSVRSGRTFSRCSLPLRITTTSTSRSGRARHRHVEVFPRAHVGGAELRDHVAGLDAGASRRATRAAPCRPSAGRSRYASTSAPCIKTTASSTTASSDVHHRTGDQDLKALPLRLGQELIVAARRCVFGVLAGHLHVAAERDDADAVLRVAALDLENLRSETERERDHAHAVPAREQEVAELVDEDEHAENEQERKKRGHSLL